MFVIQGPSSIWILTSALLLLQTGYIYVASATGAIPRNNASQILAFSLSSEKGCKLFPSKDSFPAKVTEALNEGHKMIKYKLTLPSNGPDKKGNGDNKMYKPGFWIRSTSKQGTSLLLLPPTYDVLSLTTLELGVETMDVTLKDYPENCFSNMTYEEMEGLIRELVMNDFVNVTDDESGTHLNPTDNICNMHIMNDAGTAEFHFYCCHRSEDGVLKCKTLETDIWLDILLVAITILKVIVVLYSPMLIPDSMYREKYSAMPYIYRLPEGQEVKLKTVVTRDRRKYKRASNMFKLSVFKNMSKFTTKLQKLKEDVPYILTLKDILIKVHPERLVPEDYAPVSLLSSLNESFLQCQIKERKSIKECCEADFFRCCNCTDTIFPWYALLRNVVNMIIAAFIVLPWAIRVYVYYTFENSEMIMRKQEASARNLKVYFPGNVTSYLTPLHALFIFIYVLLTLEFIVFGVIGKETKEKAKLVLRKCFRDMREMNNKAVIAWLVHTLSKPCTRWGAFGFCMGILILPFSLPVLLLVFSFYMFPTVNITLRLVGHFFVFIFPKTACINNEMCIPFSKSLQAIENQLEMETNKAEDYKNGNSDVKHVQQLIIITLSLISMYSIIFILTELVSFVVEVCVYTLMGLILNSSRLLPYYSLILLFVFYANDIFGTVTNTFLAFNKTMNDVVRSLNTDEKKQEEVESILYEAPNAQKNFAFKMETKRAKQKGKPVQMITSPKGHPQWLIARLLLFIDSKDKQMIPKRFFFDSCKMPYHTAPGDLLNSYLRAAAKFGMILLFLLFVLVVVLAFGDSYEISTSNKLLAIVVSGILPKLLGKIYKSRDVTKTDPSTIHFKICLNDLVEGFDQNWPISDILVDSVEEASLVEGQEVKPGGTVEQSGVRNHDDNTSSNITTGGIIEMTSMKTLLLQSGDVMTEEVRDMTDNSDRPAVETSTSNISDTESTIDLLIDIKGQKFTSMNVDKVTEV